MTQEPTISDLEKQIQSIREEQIESEKCTQQIIQHLQIQIDNYVKETRQLKRELQTVHEQLRKCRM